MAHGPNWASFSSTILWISSFSDPSAGLSVGIEHSLSQSAQVSNDPEVLACAEASVAVGCVWYPIQTPDGADLDAVRFGQVRPS